MRWFNCSLLLGFLTVPILSCNQNVDAGFSQKQEESKSSDKGSYEVNQSSSEDDSPKVYIPDHLQEEKNNVEVYEGSVIANDTTAAYLTDQSNPGVTHQSNSVKLRIFSDQPEKFKDIDIILTPTEEIKEQEKANYAVFYFLKGVEHEGKIGLLPLSDVTITEDKKVSLKSKGQGTYQLGKFSQQKVTVAVEKMGLTRPESTIFRSFFENFNFSNPVPAVTNVVRDGSSIKLFKTEGDFFSRSEAGDALVLTRSGEPLKAEENIANLFKAGTYKYLSLELGLVMKGELQESSPILSMFKSSSEPAYELLAVPSVNSGQFDVELILQGETVGLWQGFVMGERYIFTVNWQSDNTIAMYINGDKEFENRKNMIESMMSRMMSLANFFFAETFTLRLGWQADQVDQGFDAELGAFSLYDKELTPEQVKAHAVRLLSYDDY